MLPHFKISTITTLINDNNFSIVISIINGLLTFYFNNSFILYTNNIGSIGQILGFNLNTSYLSYSNILNALYPLNLLGYKCLEVYIQDIYTLDYFSLNSGVSTLLCIVAIDQPWSFNHI